MKCFLKITKPGNGNNEDERVAENAVGPHYSLVVVWVVRCIMS